MGSQGCSKWMQRKDNIHFGDSSQCTELPRQAGNFAGLCAGAEGNSAVARLRAIGIGLLLTAVLEDRMEEKTLKEWHRELPTYLPHLRGGGYIKKSPEPAQPGVSSPSPCVRRGQSHSVSQSLSRSASRSRAQW